MKKKHVDKPCDMRCLRSLFLDIKWRQRIHGNKVGKAGIHDTVVHREFDKSLNPGTRMKKGFKSVTPSKGKYERESWKSNGVGYHRKNWRVACQRRLLFFQRNKLWFGPSLSQYVLGPVLGPCTRRCRLMRVFSP